MSELTGAKPWYELINKPAVVTYLMMGKRLNRYFPKLQQAITFKNTYPNYLGFVETITADDGTKWDVWRENE